MNLKDMHRDDLLRYIWQEKREKVVDSVIYPIGISITIDNLNFDWHMIIYGILALLRRNPQQALEWSRHWGRAIVMIHPEKPLSFNFTTDEGDEEKMGVVLSTDQKINSLNFINSKYNIGYYNVLLNLEQISLEGAILQIERMVDEAVWCNFLRTKRLLQDKLSEDEVYALAVEDIWEKGVRIAYVKEEQILDMKRMDMSLPVRVYGNVLNSNIVPRVIGAVVLPDFNCSIAPNVIDRVKTHRSPILDKIAKAKIKINNCVPEIQHLTIIEDSFVCVGVTLAKELHIGHILSFSYAAILRKTINSHFPLYLEANDVGERIFGLVAGVAEKYNISAQNAINALSENKITFEEINLCYQTRKENGYLFKEARKILKDNNFPLLKKCIDDTILQLQNFGFSQIKIISDSSCNEEYQNLIKRFDDKLLNLGFHFLRYRDGSRKKMIVLKRRGLPTAVAMRTSFLMKAKLSHANTIPIFVDADKSITQAKDLFLMMDKGGVIQIEGVGVGFEMKMASGTSGNIITARELWKIFHNHCSINGDELNNYFLATLSFFLLTRWATSKAYKRHTFDKYHPVGLSFFDYKDNQAFIKDFLLCAEEMFEFLRLIENIKKRIISKINNECSSIYGTQFSRKRFDYLLNKLAGINTENRIDRLFLKPKILKLETDLQRIRAMIFHRFKSRGQDDSIMISVDRAIVESILMGDDIITTLDRIFTNNKVVASSLSLKFKNRLSCFFIDNLLQRGYSREEAINLSVDYLGGRFCLVKKRSAHFELLKEIIAMIKALKSVNIADGELILNSLSLCCENLSFLERMGENARCRS